MRLISQHTVNTDDLDLIADCLGGRTESFGVLVRRYQDRLYNTVLRVVENAEDAQDVVQEAFLSAYQSLHRFHAEAQFYTWLYRIAINSAISLKRRQKSRLIMRDSGGNELRDYPERDAETRPDRGLERREDEERVRSALGRLSPEHRAVLVLKELEDRSYEEIASLLQVPIGTIRSRLHRARMELREILHEEEN